MNKLAVLLLPLTLLSLSCGEPGLIGDDQIIVIDDPIPEPAPEPGPSPSSAPSCERHKGCKIIKKYSDHRHFKVDCGHDD